MNYIRNLDGGTLGIDFSKVCYVESTRNGAYIEIHFDCGSTLHLSTSKQAGRDFETAWNEYSKDCQMRERIAAFQA